MRRCVMLAMLGASVLLAGCSAFNQPFSCISSVSSRNGGDAELATRPATRNASGYYHC